MKLLLTLAATLILSVCPAYAQGVAFLCRDDTSLDKKRTAEVVDKTQAAYGRLKSLKARFSQEAYLSSMDISELSTGEVWFVKPGRMKWHYRDPEEQIFVVRDENVWLYQVSEKQVVIDQFSRILISDLPVAFLMGIGDLKKDFEVLKACENKDDGSYLLELRPKKEMQEKDGQLKSFMLVVDRAGFIPKGARVSDIGSNINTILFAEIHENPEIEESEFKTDFPSGTDINDRRVIKFSESFEEEEQE